MAVLQWVQSGVARFFEYDTPRIVHIRSKRIGVLSRFVQLGIISYVIGYAMVYNKGYQERDKVVSAVTTKVKGIIQTNFSEAELSNVPAEWRPLYRRVWDVADFVVPPEENKAVFIMTNLIITPNQTRSTCPERGDSWPCERDADCGAGQLDILSHGVPTGQCDLTTNTCTVSAWCPVENDQLPLGEGRPVLEEADTFTVLIKNQIYFPKFHKQRSNILEAHNKTYLNKCRYSEADPFCPVFNIGDIVRLSGVQKFSDISVFGGVINVDIGWSCDLDHDFMSHCRPQYSFSRLDDPHSKIAPGLNYRRAEYYSEDRRTLYKTFGINLVVNVHGEAGKFSLIPTLLNLGAGLALLSITTVICDIIVLYFMDNREYYQDKKYLNVDSADAWSGFGRFSTENPNYRESETNNTVDRDL